MAIERPFVQHHVVNHGGPKVGSVIFVRWILLAFFHLSVRTSVAMAGHIQRGAIH